MRREIRVLLVIIAYSAFVALGLGNGLLGVAWPSIRGAFGLTLDAVGTLLVATTIGYLLSSFSSGPIISRFGIGNLLLVSSLMSGVGLLGYSLAPTWWLMVLLGLLAGAGSGAIDASLNTYFATNHSAGLMNWLHACWGLGSALGPALMTAVLNAGRSWRWGYGIVGGLQALFVLFFGLTLDRWRLGGAGAVGVNPGPSDGLGSPSHSAGKMGSGATLRLPAVWLGIGLFFLFTGLEGSAGQWPYTLFTEARAVAPSTAGLWVSIYWSSLTAGRIVFGLVADRLSIVSLLRGCMLGAIVGTVFVWWNITEMLSFLGLALVGFSVAPLFPLLTSDAPRRVGPAHAPNAIGFQVAAASLGIGLLPGLAGVLAENLGLEVIGPFLFVVSSAAFLLHEASLRRSV